MYKNKILATAVLLAGTTAQAATWQNAGVVAVTHTDQGIEKVSTATGVAISSGLVRLGAEYSLNDTIKFTLSASKATNASWPTSLAGIVTGDDGTILINKAGGEAIGQTVLTMDGANFANIKVGNEITCGTNTDRFVTAISGNDVTITPKLTAACADDAVVTLQNPHDMTFGLIASDSTSATYRVTAIANGTTTIGSYVQTPQINVLPADLIAADVSISMSSATAAGVAFDALAGSLTVAKSVPQFVVAVTPFDAVVDVEQSKKAFTDGTPTASSDALTFTYTNSAGATATAAEVNGSGVLAYDNSNITAVVATSDQVVHTIDSDFNWMDTDAATAGVQTSQATGAVNTPAINAAGTAITVTDAGIATETLTLTKNVAATIIPQSTFSGKSVYTYTTGGVAGTYTTTHASLGSWSLNGASITAYGVPMGSTVSRFLWVNNKGASSAPVTATVTTAGQAYGPYSVGTAGAKSALSMSAALDAALVAAGVTLADNSRANIVFEAPVKASDVTVSAAYKHIADADRLSLETSDTIQDSISVSGTIAANSNCTGTTTSTAAAFTGDQVGDGDAITSQGVAASTGAITDMDCALGGGTVTTSTTAK